MNSREDTERSGVGAITLLPCPFCGSGAAITEDGRRFYVACLGLDCFCCVGEGYDAFAMPDHAFYEEETAAAAWNRRTAPRSDDPPAPVSSA